MYNKIFTKILDSSIWLESDTTRIIWLTLLATMDEDGFCQFASVANLAHRAVVSPDKAEIAVNVLQSPDHNSSDPDNEGRRIERVNGGWMVLNARKYRDITTRIVAREQTRVRVANLRAKRREAANKVTECNANVTAANDLVTTSEAEAKAESLNPLPPLEKQTPSAEIQKPIELDVYSAAKGLGEIIGVGSRGPMLNRLVSAIQQAERRWPDKNREQVIESLVALWREYQAQGLHAPIAIHNWLDTVGRFIDSDDWKKNKKPIFTPQIDWQGGHFREDGVYVFKDGSRAKRGYTPPKAPQREAL